MSEQQPAKEAFEPAIDKFFLIFGAVAVGAAAVGGVLAKKQFDKRHAVSDEEVRDETV